MNDLGTHVLLFAAIALAIAGISSIFAEPDDAKALKSLPKRLLVFGVGCAIVAAVMLFVEHTFASVS